MRKLKFYVCSYRLLSSLMLLRYDIKDYDPVRLNSMWKGINEKFSMKKVNTFNVKLIPFKLLVPFFSVCQ